ncbi:MAG: electron transport complex subunit RsxA [bacterium]|nr:electron transport complex subunit RsxA [bacterium]
MEYLELAIGAIFISNILLIQYLGNCPFLGVSKKMDTAIGMSGAVLFVMTLAAIVTWLMHHKILVPYNLEYLKTIVFILVIAALVQFIEMFLKKAVPPLYKSLGIFLPLITTNCAVMGVALINIKKEYDFIHMLVFSITSAIGFSLALVLFAGIREKFETARIPESYQGTAIGLVTAGLMALAFFGFKGLV